MASFKLFLFAICVIGAFAKPGDGKHKKHMECGMQTKKLAEDCCPMPKFDELKEDAECKSHLDGIEEKEDKEKGMALSCFIDCIYKNNGLIDGKDLKWDEIRTFNDKYIGADSDFKDVIKKAIDFCEEVDKKMKEKFEKFKKDGEHDGPPKHQHKCNFIPIMATGCITGYIVRDCPAAKWSDSDECNTYKSNVTSIEECTSP